MIIIPYTVKHILTLEAAPKEARWLYVGDGPKEYWRVAKESWQEVLETEDEEGLIFLEHDVVWSNGVGEAFHECSKWWCTNPYADICCVKSMNAWRNCLGCTRFRFEIIQRYPDLFDRINVDFRNWGRLCDGMGLLLREDSLTNHWHHLDSFGGPVVHHHMSLVGLENRV